MNLNPHRVQLTESPFVYTITLLSTRAIDSRIGEAVLPRGKNSHPVPRISRRQFLSPRVFNS